MSHTSRSTCHASRVRKNIFTVPDIYDALHWWKTDDIDFITRWSDKTGGPVLELAAGTGRLAIPIIERGHTYLGLDSSPDYVAFAAAKLAPYSVQGNIIQGDMRSFDLGQTFEFIFIGFNSFFHLMTDNDAQSCLECVYKHFSVSGKFIVDIFIPEPNILYREDKFYHVVDFNHPAGGKCTVREKNKYNPETQINHIQWYFFREGNEEPELFGFDMHMIFPDTMDRLLSDAGFVIEQKWGDHDERRFNVESNLQIYLCSK